MIRLKSLLSEQENARPIDDTKLNLTYLITGVVAALTGTGFTVWAKLIQRRDRRRFTDAVSTAIQQILTPEQWPYIRQGMQSQQTMIAQTLKTQIQSIPKGSNDPAALNSAILEAMMQFINNELNTKKSRLTTQQDTALRAELTPIITEWVGKLNLAQ